MNTSVISKVTAQVATKSSKVYAKDILNAFNEYASVIKVLSLDCFDTLLWRNVTEPTDVFSDLAHRPAFKKVGISKLVRIEAENTCAKYNLMRHGTTQVTLKEIYTHVFPSLSEDQISLLMEEELAAEVDACYAFSPIVELIRAAHAKNIKIIIVSDTYLSKSYLTRLLAAKLPADVFAALSEIFCSCEYQYSKSSGLFATVLNKIKVSPQSVLHVGDNPIADIAAAKNMEMHSLHLLHHDTNMEEVLRMQTIAASLFDTSIRVTRPATSPFLGIFAHHLTNPNAESLIGYAAAGPVLYAFSRFIRDEIDKLKAAGKNPKVLFLMRDAYLPSLVCETVEGKPLGKRVRISRFSSYAASFRKKEDIESYLANNIQSKRYADLANQLLLPEKISAIVLKRIAGKNNASQEFYKFIMQPDTVSVILDASIAYRKRLFRYLEKEVDLKSGDYLFFVDLGYTGTTQNKLAPVFKDEMNVETFGCYLISLRTSENAEYQSTRAGLFNPELYDDHALVMLVSFIAVFEQICTSNEASVVDFDEQGNPIYSDVMVHDNQKMQLNLIQSECLRFARDAHDFCLHSGSTVTSIMLRDVAAASLTRFIFFLTKLEREYLQTFKFEVNLGTNDVLELINVKTGLCNLRRKGWLHSLKDSSKIKRMNYPAELRAINYSLVLSLIAEHRFGIKLSMGDLSQQREKLEVIIASGNDYSKVTLDAMPTYDGYFSVLVPVVNDQCEIGICFGQLFRWIEFESAELIRFDHLYTFNELEYTEDASPHLALKEIHDHGAEVFECQSEESMLIFVPDSTKTKFADHTHIFRVVFRPVGARR